jgi:hypothetical protein
MAELDAFIAGHLEIIGLNSQINDLPSAYKGMQRAWFQKKSKKPQVLYEAEPQPSTLSVIY